MENEKIEERHKKIKQLCKEKEVPDYQYEGVTYITDYITKKGINDYESARNNLINLIVEIEKTEDQIKKEKNKKPNLIKLKNLKKELLIATFVSIIFKPGNFFQEKQKNLNISYNNPEE